MIEAVVARHRDALWLRSLRGMLVCPPGSDESRLIHAPGDLVWELLAEPTTVAAIADHLCERFDAPPAEVAADVAALIADLVALGAVDSTVDSTVDDPRR